MPPNVIDVRQENKEDYEFVYADDPEIIAAEGPILQFPNSSIPSAPSTYIIVGQTLRMANDGSQVVDVEIEFPDVGTDIDVRITPA